MVSDYKVRKIKELSKSLLKKQNTVFIGIAGGSGSGKTFLARKLGGKIISVDDYYIGIDNMVDNNFDHPKSVELKLLRKQLTMLREGKMIKKPVYDFRTHKRKSYENFGPDKIIVIEGLFALNDILKDAMDIRIFIDSPKEIRLKRRVRRDLNERGRLDKSIEKMFNSVVEPMYLKHVLTTKNNADIVIRN